MKPTLFNLDIETKEVEGNTVAEVTIDGIIGFDFWEAEDDQNTKQKMREQLKRVDAIEADKIVVNISSLGGDVDHGLAIHDLLASNSAPVETHVIGMTASAATIIAQAGDERFMSDNALYLVHRAWTIGMGNANDFAALAKDLETIDDRISNIYAKRSGFDQSDFMELMNEANGDGIWISADDALDYGLIDTVTEPMKVAALDKSIFDRYEIPKPPQADEQETEDGNVLTYKVNLDLHVNGKPYEGTMKDLQNDISTLVREEDVTLSEEEEEKYLEQSANAPARERAKYKQTNIKIKTL